MSGYPRMASMASVVILVLLIPCAALAHRLDEYLQAARISIEADRVLVELNLTPGADVADGVFETIDLDRNGAISPSEGDSYANRVVNSLSLSIDGQAHRLKLDDYTMPALAEMQSGEGIIRLRASSPIGLAAPGRHQLRFANPHRTDISEYLVNALVPSDERIHINGQSRDTLQRQIRLDYTVSPGYKKSSVLAALAPLFGLAMVTVLFVCRRAAQ